MLPRMTSAWSGGADELARPHVHLQHFAVDECSHGESVEVGLRLIDFGLLAIDGRLGHAFVVLPGAGFQQVEIGHGLVVPLAGAKCRLLSLLEFFLGNRFIGDQLFAAGPLLFPHFPIGFCFAHAGFRCGQLLGPGHCLESLQCNLGIGEHGLTHGKLGLPLAIVDAE